MIYIGADHQGFKAKESIIEYFTQNNIEYFDCGNAIYEDEDDYPDYAFAVGEKVSEFENVFGILICKSGEGMTIAANKVKGAYAALCEDIERVKLAREHNNANILVIDARHSFETSIEMINTFINTSTSEEKRHIRRREKIKEYENKHIAL